MDSNNQIIIYQTEDGQTQVDVRLENETVWLSTSQMAMLFDKEESNIRRHVINVFKEGELERENNVQKIHVNGIKKPVPYYNLDVIISVGYRVKSKRGTAFRIWARKILKDYLIKGYAINERMRKEQIGELRQLVGELKVTNLLGVSISKEFMPSIANTIGTDMSTYKVVERDQLVYIADTSRRGDKIAAYLASHRPSPLPQDLRRWATQRLHEYIQKGFTMDDERLKQGELITTITCPASLPRPNGCIRIVTALLSVAITKIVS